MTTIRSFSVHKHMAKKNAILTEFRATHGCALCGEQDPVVLDLDHVDPDGKHPKLRTRNSRSWWHLNWVDFYAELEKVRVLCANCHRRETHRRRLALRELAAMAV